jgi:hypothetical protein
MPATDHSPPECPEAPAPPFTDEDRARVRATFPGVFGDKKSATAPWDSVLRVIGGLWFAGWLFGAWIAACAPHYKIDLEVIFFAMLAWFGLWVALRR